MNRLLKWHHKKAVIYEVNSHELKRKSFRYNKQNVPYEYVVSI